MAKKSPGGSGRTPHLQSPKTSGRLRAAQVLCPDQGDLQDLKFEGGG